MNQRFSIRRLYEKTECAQFFRRIYQPLHRLLGLKLFPVWHEQLLNQVLISTTSHSRQKIKGETTNSGLEINFFTVFMFRVQWIMFKWDQRWWNTSGSIFRSTGVSAGVWEYCLEYGSTGVREYRLKYLSFIEKCMFLDLSFRTSVLQYSGTPILRTVLPYSDFNSAF